MSDKGSIHFTGLGHQFKSKARTYQSIANDLKDVMREHESIELSNDAIIKAVAENMKQCIELLESASIHEEDTFNDRD